MLVLRMDAAMDAAGRFNVTFVTPGPPVHAFRDGGTWQRTENVRSGAYPRFGVSAFGEHLNLVYVGNHFPDGPTGWGTNAVFIQTFEGERWRELVVVHLEGEHRSHDPLFLSVDAGDHHMVWLDDTTRDVIPKEVYHARSPDGLTWSEPERITPEATEDRVLGENHLFLDSAGRLNLIFTRHRRNAYLGHSQQIFQMRLDGDEWSEAWRPFPDVPNGNVRIGVSRDHQHVYAVWKGVDLNFYYSRFEG